MKLLHVSRAASRSGFTLVEIILVTVIIMILVSITGQRIVGQAKAAKKKAAKIEMAGIKGALQQFELHASRFPTTQEGLQALIAKPADLSEDDWAGPYLDKGSVPKDPFGTEYGYACPSAHGADFDLFSAGADKKLGTEDDLSAFADEKAT